MGFKMICYDKDEEEMFLTRQFPSVFKNTTVSKIGASAFDGVSAIKNMEFTEVTSLDAYALYRCGAENFSFPKLESLGSHAFAYCQNVKELYAPNITYVSDYAFEYYSASSLELLNISYFGSYVFQHYSGIIDEIILSGPGLSIGTSGQFSNLYDTRHLKINDMETASYYAFAYFTGRLSTDDGYAEFPDLIYASNQAFAYCSHMSCLSAPKLQTLGESAFNYCSKLQEVYLPNVETISTYAFNYCSSLASVDFPKCSKLEESAFYYCVNLSEARLDTIQEISNYAFYGCYALSDIHMSGITSVPTLYDSRAFSNCTSLAHIYVPTSLVTAFQTATNWSYYSSLISGIY